MQKIVVRHMPVILALWRMRQEDCKLEDSLCYIVRLCLKEREGETARVGDIFQCGCLAKAWRSVFGSCIEEL